MALVVALAFPSFNVPRFSEAGAGAGGWQRRAAGGTPTVEMVLQSSASQQGNMEAGLVGTVGGSLGSKSDFGANSGRRAAAAAVPGGGSSSRAAFVGPWNSVEEQVLSVGSAAAPPTSVRQKGVVASVTAVKKDGRGGSQQKKMAGGKLASKGRGGGEVVSQDGTIEALQNVADSVTDSGREIAVDFFSHLQVCVTCTMGQSNRQGSVS